MQSYDVIIIGGGAVGSAVARELTRYRLSVAVLEKESDVCTQTSGRNTGMLHAGYLLLFMLALAPLMRYVPLAALSAVLLVVAWNMSEVEHFRNTLSAPWGDRLVLLLTFFLTVLLDLTVAIQAGVVLAAFVFMYRMAEAVEASSGVRTELSESGDDDPGQADPARDADREQRAKLPKGVEAYQIGGPLFFGAANRLDNLLDQFFEPPKVLILRMRLVPVIDASGVHALKKLAERCHRQGIVLIVSGLQAQPNRVIAKMRLEEHPGELHFVSNFERALKLARSIVGDAG